MGLADPVVYLREGLCGCGYKWLNSTSSSTATSTTPSDWFVEVRVMRGGGTTDLYDPSVSAEDRRPILGGIRGDSLRNEDEDGLRTGSSKVTTEVGDRGGSGGSSSSSSSGYSSWW